MTSYKELEKLKLKEQDCVIVGGMVLLKLDRKSEAIVKIPAKYKYEPIHDVYGEFTMDCYDTVLGRVKERTFMVGKFWLYNPETGKFILLDTGIRVMANI